MRINLRYQVVLFSDFSGVKDDESTRGIFLNSIKNHSFIVKPLIEATIGPSGVSNQSRPSFQSPDGSFSVAINTDKTVFEYVYTDINVSKQMSMKEFISNVLDVCEFTEIYSARNYKRIGLIRVTFFDGIDTGKFYRSFCHGIKFYDSYEMKDWSVFFPAKVTLNNGREINATSRISKVYTRVRKNSSNMPFQGLALETDVNTLSTNRIDNISWAEMKSILHEILDIEYDITNQTAHEIERTDTQL